MIYRIVSVLKVKSNSLHYEVQYKKWFRWITVKQWHETLPFEVPMKFETEEAAKNYVDDISSPNEFRCVVAYKNVKKPVIHDGKGVEIKRVDHFAKVRESAAELEKTIDEWEQKYGKLK